MAKIGADKPVQIPTTPTLAQQGTAQVQPQPAANASQALGTSQPVQQAGPTSGSQFEASTTHQATQPLPTGLMKTASGQPAPRGQSLFAMALGGADGLPATGTTPLFALQHAEQFNAVGLNDVLAQIPNNPEGKAMVEGLLQQIQAKTGVEIPAGMVDAVLANPARLSNVLQLTPAELKGGVAALNARHSQREPAADATPAAKLQLPAQLDMAQLDQLDIKVPEPQLKELGPGLWQGDVKSDISEAQAKTNIATAGILDRLAANGQGGEDFSVTYQGQSFDRLDNFLTALQADGHTIEVGVNQRVANFSALKTMGPNGQMVDVPAPMFVRTGVKDADGNEATIPAVHSELTITIRKGDNTEGPGFDADLKWYQGISGTGFFPDKLSESPPWAGGQTREIGSGDAAIDAIKLAGMLSDSINEAASEQDLWLGGYGTTGVCNDSVAVIEHAMTGRNLTYPLLMTDESILPELNERLAANPQDSAAYERLIDSVKLLPSDAIANDSSRTRAAHTIPWTPGNEPFVSTSIARDILEP